VLDTWVAHFQLRPYSENKDSRTGGHPDTGGVSDRFKY
jgi:hypothetical protein